MLKNDYMNERDAIAVPEAGKEITMEKTADFEIRNTYKTD